MNDLQIFKNEEFGEIRTVQLNNEVYFAGKDVAEALGYKNTKDALCGKGSFRSYGENITIKRICVLQMI